MLVEFLKSLNSKDVFPVMIFIFGLVMAITGIAPSKYASGFNRDTSIITRIMGLFLIVLAIISWLTSFFDSF